MSDWQAADVLDAAVRALINERCLGAYIHDMRGGLQAIYSSVELLTRSAKHNAQNTAFIDGAASLAKRALENHEHTMVAILNQIAGTKEAPTTINLATVIKEIQQFLRNDALNKNITITLSGREDLVISGDHNMLRSQMLRALVMTIDALPHGAQLNIELSNIEGQALVELKSELTYHTIRKAEELFRQQPSNIEPQQLIMGSVQQWITANGGRVEIPTQSSAPNGLRIYYPLTGV